MIGEESQVYSESYNAELPWWAIYTRHQHEKSVATALVAKGHEVFLPLYSSVHKWKDRRKTIELPLFPCYVFVRGAQSRRLSIVTTPGVHMVLTEGDAPAIIREDEIAAIRHMIDGQMKIEPHPFLRCGQRVRVMQGALEGVEGILVRVRNLYRLVLSVEILNKSVSVEIDADSVEAVPGARLKDSRSNALAQRTQEPGLVMG